MEKKNKYVAPVIEKVVLDNHISLILESEPPAGPNETNLRMNNDSFKQDVLMV